MAFFSFLDNDSDITDLTFNDRARLGPLDKVSHAIMRGKSDFSIAERELMAAYVSALNACTFCFGIHHEVANNFGIAPDLIEKLVDDLPSAPINEKLHPVLLYLKKLTLAPSQIVKEDVDKVTAAGWSEEALQQAILVGCLFNFYNRLLDGHGIKGHQAIYKIGADHLSKSGYKVPFFIGLIKNFIKKAKTKKLQKMKNQK